jgi:hypothetical protein
MLPCSSFIHEEGLGHRLPHEQLEGVRRPRDLARRHLVRNWHRVPSFFVLVPVPPSIFRPVVQSGPLSSPDERRPIHQPVRTATAVARGRWTSRDSARRAVASSHSTDSSRANSPNPTFFHPFGPPSYPRSTTVPVSTATKLPTCPSSSSTSRESRRLRTSQSGAFSLWHSPPSRVASLSHPSSCSNLPANLPSSFPTRGPARSSASIQQPIRVCFRLAGSFASSGHRSRSLLCSLRSTLSSTSFANGPVRWPSGSSPALPSSRRDYQHLPSPALPKPVRAEPNLPAAFSILPPSSTTAAAHPSPSLGRSPSAPSRSSSQPLPLRIPHAAAASIRPTSSAVPLVVVREPQARLAVRGRPHRRSAGSVWKPLRRAASSKEEQDRRGKPTIFPDLLVRGVRGQRGEEAVVARRER